MIPTLRLLDAFKLQDHQAVRVPIPFEGFSGSPLYQVCAPILFDCGTDSLRIGLHALPIEDLEIGNDIGGHVSNLRVCSLSVLFCSSWFPCFSSPTLLSSLRFPSCWEGIPTARLNLFDAFFQAMISVSSHSSSSL